jgi:hypothetical protein
VDWCELGRLDWGAKLPRLLLVLAMNVSAFASVHLAPKRQSFDFHDVSQLVKDPESGVEGLRRGTAGFLTRRLFLGNREGRDDR